MSDYFGQMKHELHGTNVQDDEGPEDWDKPLASSWTKEEKPSLKKIEHFRREIVW